MCVVCRRRSARATHAQNGPPHTHTITPCRSKLAKRLQEHSREGAQKHARALGDAHEVRQPRSLAAAGTRIANRLPATPTTVHGNALPRAAGHFAHHEGRSDTLSLRFPRLLQALCLHRRYVTPFPPKMALPRSPQWIGKARAARPPGSFLGRVLGPFGLPAPLRPHLSPATTHSACALMLPCCSVSFPPCRRAEARAQNAPGVAEERGRERRLARPRPRVQALHLLREGGGLPLRR